MTARSTGWVAVVLASVVAGVVACGPKREEIEKSTAAGRVAEIQFPSTAEIAAVQFAQGPSSVVAVWVERTNASGSVLFSKFDGTAWSSPVTVVGGVDADAVSSRGPAIDITPSGALHILWFGVLDGGPRTPRIEVSSDGGATWTHGLKLTPSLATGAGPIAMVAADGLPTLAYVKEYRSIVQPVTQAAFVAHPGLHVSGFEETFLETMACPNAGISAVRYAGHAVVAYRAFNSIESKTDGATHVLLCDVDPSGLTQATAGDLDGWDMPIGARAVGPVLATSGRRIVYAYYSARRKGSPAILVYFGGFTDSPSRLHAQRAVFPDGVAIPVIGDTHDLTAHFSGDWIVLTAVEDGQLVEHYLGFRQFYSFRLFPAPIPDSTRVRWTGALGDRNYIAWSQDSRIHFARALHGPATEAGKALRVAPGPGIHYLSTPTPTPEQSAPAPDADAAP